MEEKLTMRWETLSGRQKRSVEAHIVPIYRWIEENKCKLKNGVTSSTMFAHVVPRDKENTTYNTPGGTMPEGLAKTYFSNTMNWKHKGWLRYEKETPNGPKVWSVNEACLPPGVVNYTGIKHTIPLDATPGAKTQPQPPVVLPPVEDKAEKFLEAELKSIKIRDCRFGNGPVGFPHAGVEMHDVTLWDVYKLGLALQGTLGTTHYQEEEPKEETNEQNPVEQQTQPTKSMDSTEEIEECESTSAPF